MTVENVIRDRSMLHVTGITRVSEGPSTADLPDAPPVRIIQRDQDYFVHFRWSQSGWLCPLIGPGVNWECRVYFEQWGLGEVSNLPPVTVSFVPSDPHTYVATVRIPRGFLPEGAYKFVSTLMLRGPRNRPTPVAAYEEEGMLQVYED